MATFLVEFGLGAEKAKAQLPEYSRKMHPSPTYKIQKIADMFTEPGLPVAHPELSLLDLVWSSVKRYVTAKNNTFRLNEVEKLIGENVLTITAEDIEKFTVHSVREEEKCRDMSKIADDEDVEEGTVTESSGGEGRNSNLEGFSTSTVLVQ